MIDNTHYAAYEALGEPCMDLVYTRGCEEMRLQLWVGHWNTLMDCMFEQYGAHPGILLAWQRVEDFSMWRVPDPADEIRLLRSFRLTPEMQAAEYGGLTDRTLEIRDCVLRFLQSALAAGVPVYLDEN